MEEYDEILYETNGKHAVLLILIGLLMAAGSNYLVPYFPVIMAIVLGYGAIVILINAVKVRTGDKNMFLLNMVLGIALLITLNGKERKDNE